MKQFKHSLAACAGLLLVIGLLALDTPGTTRGQGVNVRPASDVNVVNTPEVNVVNTVRVSEARREPFNAGVQLLFNPGQNSAAGDFPDVPAGKQLVVTYASAIANLPPLPAQQVGAVRIFIEKPDGTAIVHGLAPPAQTDTLARAVTGGPLNLYLDPGSRLSILAFRNSFDGSGSIVVSISGYLVDVP